MSARRRRGRGGGTSFGVRLTGTDPTIPCEVCGAATERARLYELAGSAGDVMVTLMGVPSRLCRDDAHPRRPSSNDFEAKLSESIFSSGTFPMVRTGRLRRLVCASCGKRMKDTRERAGRVEANVRVDGADVTVAVTAPVTSCPRCGAEQLVRTPASARAIQDAVDHALARGGLRR